MDCSLVRVVGPAGAVGLVLALAGSGRGRADEPASKPSRHEFTETHMGSPFRIVLYTTTEPAARRASRAAFGRIAALDATLSDYDPDSELSRLSAASGGPPLAVSDDLFALLERAQEMARRSEGAFDITVGPVVRLWRRARRRRELPEPDRLEAARALVGYEKVRLDPGHRTAQLLRRGMKLDPGGIAKGYAASEALAILRRQGIAQALVAGAGDIAVGAPPPGAEGWTIGVAALEAPGGPPDRYLLLHDRCVSTSGDTERFIEVGGRRYSHIVDPQTGLGLVGRSSVTVVAPDGATADALATAISVLGPTRGLALADATEGAAALFVRRTDSGLESFASKRWASLPAGRAKTPPQPAETRP